MGWLENRLRKRRVAPSDGDARNGTWSAADKACLQRAIDPLRANFRRRPFAFLGSEATTMLCSSKPGEVYERLTSMLSNMSIVSGVVLSAFAGAALSPLAPDDYPPAARAKVDAFNAVAAVTVAIQLLVCLYSTFTLYILTANAPSPSATYRHLMHMARWIGFLEFMTFVPALGGFVLVGIAATLRCGDFALYVVAAVAAAFVTFQVWFVCLNMWAFPYNSWCWALPAGSGVPWMLSWNRDLAEDHGRLLLDEAREGVLAGLDDDGDDVIDNVREPERARELEDWIRTALPGFPRCVDVAEDLLANGLTRDRLVEAATLPGGFQVLVDMLSAQMKGSGLRPGERLAVAAAAMRDAAAVAVTVAA